jgi:hypothetical protein
LRDGAGLGEADVAAFDDPLFLVRAATRRTMSRDAAAGTAWSCSGMTCSTRQADRSAAGLDLLDASGMSSAI